METLKEILSALLKAVAVMLAAIIAGVVVGSTVKFLLMKAPGVTLTVLCSLIIGFSTYMFLRDRHFKL